MGHEGRLVEYVKVIEVRNLASEYDLDTLWCIVGVCDEYGKIWKENPESRQQYKAISILYNIYIIHM
jgi:hypothetical protein